MLNNYIKISNINKSNEYNNISARSQDYAVGFKIKDIL